MAGMSGECEGKSEGWRAGQRCLGSQQKLWQSLKDFRQGNKRIIFAFVDRASNALYVHLIITFQLCEMRFREAVGRMFWNVPGRGGGAGSEGHAY